MSKRGVVEPFLINPPKRLRNGGLMVVGNPAAKLERRFGAGLDKIMDGCTMIYKCYKSQGASHKQAVTNVNRLLRRLGTGDHRF